MSQEMRPSREAQDKGAEDGADIKVDHETRCVEAEGGVLKKKKKKKKKKRRIGRV